MEILFKVPYSLHSYQHWEFLYYGVVTAKEHHGQSYCAWSLHPGTFVWYKYNEQVLHPADWEKYLVHNSTTCLGTVHKMVRAPHCDYNPAHQTYTFGKSLSLSCCWTKWGFFVSLTTQLWQFTVPLTWNVTSLENARCDQSSAFHRKFLHAMKMCWGSGGVSPYVLILSSRWK